MVNFVTLSSSERDVIVQGLYDFIENGKELYENQQFFTQVTLVKHPGTSLDDYKKKVLARIELSKNILIDVEKNSRFDVDIPEIDSILYSVIVSTIVYKTKIKDVDFHKEQDKKAASYIEIYKKIFKKDPDIPDFKIGY